MPELTALQADLTGLRVDAVVNAANTRLTGGGGVDGAIHRAAGPGLLEATRTLGGCPTGDVRITPGFDLPAAWVIHAVGPVWQGGQRQEASLLSSCYRKALLLCESYSLRTVAFSAISTGAYGYPQDLATEVAIGTVRKALACAPQIESVIFCCYSQELLAVYRNSLA